MKIEIKFKNDTAQRGEYFLRNRYKCKKSFERLAKIAILEIISQQANKELTSALNGYDEAAKELGMETTVEYTARKTCGTCKYGEEGTCSECAGDNYGHATEISSASPACTNWKEIMK